MEKLIAYLNSLPKSERDAFAEKCFTTVGYLRKARSAKQLLAVDTCVAIEEHSGGVVTRKDLRPNDWHRFWPELAEKAAA